MTVIFTDDARLELRGVWNYNAKNRSVAQAEKYEDFLIVGINALASRHSQGKAIKGFPGLRSMTFRKSPRGDGHIVVYQVDHDAETVNVLHVFHTKQDVQGRLGRES